MVFKKTIIHVYSDSTPFGFEEYLQGTLRLLKYANDTNMNLRVNVTNSELFQYVIVDTYDIGTTAPKIFYTNRDLVNALNRFKLGSDSIFVVSTNVSMNRAEVGNQVYVDFSNLIRFKDTLYAEALSYVENDLLNMTKTYDIKKGYNVIYVYIDKHSKVKPKPISSRRYASQIKPMLDFSKPIVVVSNDLKFKQNLSESLEINNRESILNDGDAFDTADTLMTFHQAIIDFIILLRSNKIFSFSEHNYIQPDLYDINIYTIAHDIHTMTGNLEYKSVPLCYTTSTVVGEGPLEFVFVEPLAPLPTYVPLNPSSFYYPSGITRDSQDTLYIADQANHLIRRITSSGIVQTLAGYPSSAGFQNGNGINARFSSPSGVAVDASGIVYVADTNNHSIRKITSDGTVTTFAGNGSPGFQDGNGTSARFSSPVGIVINRLNTIYVSDSGNNAIRKITLEGVVTTILSGQGCFPIAVDYLNNIYFGSSSSIIKIDPSNKITTFATNISSRGFTFDSFNTLYVSSSNNSIYKIDKRGNKLQYVGLYTGYFDDQGLYAQLNGPYGLVVDTYGYLFVVDQYNHRIRKVDPYGLVTTFAGDGNARWLDNQPLVNIGGQFNQPWGIICDSSGSLYIADRYNYVIRKVLASGEVKTIAGCPGVAGFADGKVFNAQFNEPRAITIDSSGTLYVADAYNHRIRKIKNGLVETIIGNGIAGNGNGINASITDGPMISTFVSTASMGVITDPSGNIYSCNWNTNQVIKFAPDGTQIILYAMGGAQPRGITIDSSGNLYVTCHNSHIVQKIDISGIITTIAGTGGAGWNGQSGLATSIYLYCPSGITIDPSGNLYVSDTYNHCIRKLTMNSDSTWQVETVAGGNGSNQGGYSDGPVQTALFYSPCGITLDNSGNIFIIDRNNNAIRKINLTSGMVTTLAKSGGPGVNFPFNFEVHNDLVYNENKLYITQWSQSSIYVFDLVKNMLITLIGNIDDFINGPITNSRVRQPSGICLYNGIIYIGDWSNTVIRKIIMGSGYTIIPQINYPQGVAVDSKKSIYISDTNNNVIRKVDPSGNFSIFAGNGQSGFINGSIYTPDNYPSSHTYYLSQYSMGIVLDPSGNLYCCDWGNSVVKYGPDRSFIRYYGMGSNPRGITMDSLGNLYVTCWGSCIVQKIDTSDTITTIAGTYGGGWNGQSGLATSINLSNPSGITIDSSGNLYVCDTYNHCIRKLKMNSDSTWQLETFAGSNQAGYSDGTMQTALFNAPCGITLDSSGNFFILDRGNNALRKISVSTNIVTTLAKSGGPGINYSFNFEIYNDLIYDGSGSLYIAQWNSSCVVKINLIDISYIVIDSIGNPSSLYIFNQTLYISGWTAQINTFNIQGLSYAPRFSNMLGLTVDSSGSVYVADQGNNAIRKIDASGNVSTLVIVSSPTSITYTSNTLYITSSNNTIYTIDSSGTLQIYAGVIGGYMDNVGLYSQFNGPQGITSDTSGNLYIADAYNHKIRKISKTNSSLVTTTIAGTWGGWLDYKGTVVPIVTPARYSQPWGVTCDSSGIVYVADRYNYVIRKILPNGLTSTIAGYPGVGGYQDGQGIYTTRFNEPQALTVDSSGSIYVADKYNNAIRKIDTSNTVSTLQLGINGPYSYGQVNSTSDSASTSVFAGFDCMGLTTDSSGNIYTCNWGSCSIRKYSPDGSYVILAGGNGSGFSGDGGPAINAQLANPRGIVLDTIGNVYFTEWTNQRVRMIDTSGTITTIAGTGGAGWNGSSGNAKAINLYNPSGIVIDSSGIVYVSDTNTYCIRKLEAQSVSISITLVSPSILTSNMYIPVVLVFNEKYSNNTPIQYDAISIVASDGKIYSNQTTDSSGTVQFTVSYSSEMQVTYTVTSVSNSQVNQSISITYENSPAALVLLKAINYNGSGNWLDESGNGKNAQLLRGKLDINSEGNGIILNGNSTAWQIPYVQLGSSWTVGLWYKNKGTNGGYANILTQEGDYGNCKFSIGDLDGRNDGTINVGGAQSMLLSSFTLPYNQWTNIQITYDGSIVNLYINSNLVQTNTANITLNDSGSPYRIGWCWNATNSYVIGEIGEVRMYNYINSQNQIIANYAETLSTYSLIPLGYEVWLDASTLAYEDNASIIQWPDLSGKSTLSINSSPTLTKNALNGLSVATFNTSQYLQVSPTFSGNKQSFFAVSRQTGGANARIFSSYISNELIGYWNSRKKVIYLNGNPSILEYQGSDTNWDLISLTIDTSSGYNLFWNGTNILNSSNTSTIDSLQINYSEPSNCQIAELIFYDTAAVSTRQRQIIEGYLAWKWGLQTGLPSDHPYYTVAPGLNPSTPILPLVWQPTSISNLQLWLDANDITTLTLSGSAVTQWADKSGNSYNATGINGPTLSSGRIEFNGSNQYFTTNYTAYSQAESAFIIYSINGQGQYSLVESSVARGRQFQNLSGNGPSLANNGIVWLAQGSISLQTASNYLAECLYNSSGINIYVNGVVSVSNGTNPNLSDGLTVIGGSPGQNGYYLNGTVSEVVIYNSVLTTLERQVVEGYLAWKWNIQTQLPSNHPFRSVPPKYNQATVPPSPPPFVNIWQLTTFAGSNSYGSQDGIGENAQFRLPSGLTLDNSGNLFCLDTDNGDYNAIRKINIQTRLVKTIVTNGGSGYPNGTGRNTQNQMKVNYLNDLTYDGSGNLYITAWNSNTITLFDLVRGTISTLSTIAYLSQPAGISIYNSIIYIGNWSSQNILKVTLGSGFHITARISVPQGITIDSSGNLYISDTGNSQISKINTLGQIQVIAEGFLNPLGLTVDSSGSIYLAEQGGNAIRKITKTGQISTFATINSPNDITKIKSIFYVTSSNNIVYSIDSSGTIQNYSSIYGGFIDNEVGLSRFSNPQGITSDVSGNLYIADAYNYRIRKIDTSGVVTTLSGDGNGGYLDNQIIPVPIPSNVTLARFNGPTGIAIDESDTLYIADQRNHVIRKVLQSGLTTTIAGYPGAAAFQDGKEYNARFSNPLALTVDSSGAIYVADSSNQAIRKILSDGLTTTLLSLSANGFVIDSSGTLYISSQNSIYSLNSLGTLTTFMDGFNSPQQMAIDSLNSIYVADYGNSRICKITSQGRVIVLANISGPVGIAVDKSFNIYCTSITLHTISKINSSGIITVLAGNGSPGFQDGQGIQSQFNSPYSLAIDSSGILYIADINNHRIRKIDTSGVVTTFLGDGNAGWLDNTYILPIEEVPYFNGNMTFRDTIIQTNGSILPAILFNPNGVAVDASGTIYFTDTSNNRIRKTNLAGIVKTIAGKQAPGFKNGKGLKASFSSPTGLCIDPSGVLYIADTGNNAIRRMDTSGNIQTFCSSLLRPKGVAIDSSGIIYVADTGNSRVCKIISGGILIQIAGASDFSSGYANGKGTLSKFSSPIGLTTDGKGNVYIADTGNNAIRKITPVGEVSTIIDNIGYSLSDIDLNFSSPTGIVYNSTGELYITDTNNNVIKRLSVKGYIEPVSGSPFYVSGLNDGHGSMDSSKAEVDPSLRATFSRPTGITLDSSGTIYVADSGNNMIRTIVPTFSLYTKGRAVPIQNLKISRTPNIAYTIGPMENDPKYFVKPTDLSRVSQ